MSEGTPGTEGGLKRRLGVIQTSALLFAGVGATGGVVSLWTFSYGTSGPAFFWGYPLVALLVLPVCLVWAELASHYPFAGTFFEWPRLLLRGIRSAEEIGWWIGWLYLFGLTLTLTALYIAVANAMIAFAGWHSSTHLQVEIALICLVVCLVVNVSGIERVGKIGVLGVLGELVAVGIIVTLTLILGADHSPTLLVHTPGQSFSKWIPGFIGAGVFVPIWNLYTFEGAGLLGEETKDAARSAPRAILFTLLGSTVIAMYIIFTFVLTTKHPVAAMSAANPIQSNIERVLPTWCAKLYEFVVVEVLFLSTSALLTYASRQLYGMARARELPAARSLSRTLRINGAPWTSLILVAIVSALPLFISSNIAVLVGGTTAEVYVAYCLVLLIVVVARFRGWPQKPAPFSLGRYGMAISIAALLAALAIGVDLFWPRDSTNPVWHGIRAGYWMLGVPLALGIVLRLATRFRQSPANDPIDDTLAEIEKEVLIEAR